jgi:hypothetical protein
VSNDPQIVVWYSRIINLLQVFHRNKVTFFSSEFEKLEADEGILFSVKTSISYTLFVSSYVLLLLDFRKEINNIHASFCICIR